MKPWMKSHQWLITAGLLILAIAAVIGFIFTRDLGPLQSPAVPGTAAQQKPLVDERPLHTARTLLKLASGEDERKFAERAEQLADHEVDLAFDERAGPRRRMGETCVQKTPREPARGGIR